MRRGSQCGQAWHAIDACALLNLNLTAILVIISPSTYVSTQSAGPKRSMSLIPLPVWICKRFGKESLSR